MAQKIAIITGVNGQDGSYLSEFLLDKDYIVHGVIRRSSTFNTWRIDHLLENKCFHTHYGDMIDSSNINKLIRDVGPNEVYNLAAQSHVAVSFEIPEYTAESTGVGAIRLLDAIKHTDTDIKFYQASTSELFGGLKATAPQNECTPFMPRSPYAAAKLYAYWVTTNYREAYGLYGCNGILFNHESPRRGENFVTRKITISVGKINRGELDCITLGNLDSVRDWGYAKDYVESMWLMLQQGEPDDYVIATARKKTVREFVEHAFKVINVDIVWEGEGVNEVGKDSKTNKVLVKVDPKYFRPTEVEYLLGDYSKAKKILGWEPKTSFEQLVEIMVKSDL